MKLKKLFVGIQLQKNIGEKLLKEAQDSVEFGLLPIKWIDKDNFHITLEFLGYADDDQACQIAKRLRTSLRNFPPFPVYLDKIAFGPPDKLPEMIWASGPENIFLKELNKKIITDLSDMYLLKRKAKFKFSAHITLGRLSRQEAKNLSETPKKNIKINFTVSEIALMESFQEKNKTKYAVLESIKLK